MIAAMNDHDKLRGLTEEEKKNFVAGDAIFKLIEDDRANPRVGNCGGSRVKKIAA